MRLDVLCEWSQGLDTIMGMTSDFAGSYSVSARIEDHHAEISSGVSAGERKDESAKKQNFSAKGQTDTSRKERKTIPATNGRVGQANSTRQAGGGGAKRVVSRRVWERFAWKGVCGMLHMLASFKEIAGLCGGELIHSAQTTETIPL